ncbi:uncharacterized protein B0J16DRAFT_315854 [Fusarium flagelliforme]|uniref:uncharacterized protein n=1 Tax=Fusarium flagelliforme TaxID=2675880 RepID=UPI001E8EB94E|nr:uncharacterized protein B0J16DRAFT_315854 [Fusarium flagelliforme]KAH7192167.1 hypothetical protein B0J16DRAFT_315854 [Fusarium flagelliforme]
MGGKTWSKEEERLFWEVIVPRSPVAAYPDPKNSLNWAQLAEWMNELAGDKRRREYTHTMLYEHYYQNNRPGHKSPKAQEFVEKYLLDAAYYKEHGLPRPSSPADSSTSASASTSTSGLMDPQIAEMLKNEPKPKQKQKARQPRKGRLPWDEEDEDKPSRPFFNMPKSLDDIGAYSISPGTPADAAQQRPSEGHIPSARTALPKPDSCPFPKSVRVAVPGSASAWYQPANGEEVDRYQTDGLPAPELGRTSRPSYGYFDRPGPHRVESSYWRLERNPDQVEKPGRTLPMPSGSTSAHPSQSQAPGYEPLRPHATANNQQTPQEPQSQWSGKLPSIREMLPYEFERPIHDPYAYEMTRRLDKRSFSHDQGYMQVPDTTSKRRKLPDAPVRQQQGERSQPQAQAR